jgi:flagellar protein FliO/FliZ
VKTSSSFQMLRLLSLVLLTILCAQVATAQYQKARTIYHPPVAAETKTEQAPQAQPSPEPAATPETVTPAANAQPSKESEPLPFALDEKTEANAEAPSAAGLLIRTLGALLLIVGLIVAVGWGLRRFGGARFGAKGKDAPTLSVLTSVSLGNRRSIAVVRFGERNLLIGSTAQTITLLDAEDSESGETKTPVARSVADLLKADGAQEFAQELAEASSQLNDQSLEWNESGGAI